MLFEVVIESEITKEMNINRRRKRLKRYFLTGHWSGRCEGSQGNGEKLKQQALQDNG